MRLATSLTLVGLTVCLAAPSRAVSAEPSSNVLRTSNSAIDALERLHQKAESEVIQNQFGAAVLTYSDILLLEPDDETAYTALGHCYLVQGQYKKATEAFRNALSINPENEAAILGIQKIMDPDGVEGMVHPAQLAEEEFQNTVPPAVPAPDLKQRTPINLRPLVALSHMPRLGPEIYSQPKYLTIAELEPVAPKKAVVTPIKRVPVVKRVPNPDAVGAREIQKALRNTGFYNGPIDGVLGSASRKAIKDFQILQGRTPDGIVGPKTWASLRLYLDSE